jgi:hypothetical protein
MKPNVDETICNELIHILGTIENLCSALKNEWEEDLSDDTENKLFNMYQIKNTVFAGLMLQEIPCKFIKDIELGTNEISIAIMQLMDKRYECRTQALKQILGDIYSPVFERCKSSQKQFNINGTAQLINNDALPDPVDVNEPSLVNDNQIVQNSDDAINVDVKSVYDTSKQEEAGMSFPQFTEEVEEGSDESLSEVGLQIFSTKAAEPIKTLDTMVFDITDVGVFNKKDGKGEYVNFTIVPLSIPEQGEELVSDILVCAETPSEKKVFVSGKNGQKSIITNIGVYEFIIRGSWKDGSFISSIHPANQQIIEEYEKNEEKNSIIPKDLKNIGYGHNVIFYEESDNSTSKIHIIPLDLQNNSVGMVNIMVCIEKATGERLIMVSNNNMLLYKTGDNEVQMFGYWENDTTFVANVKNR